MTRSQVYTANVREAAPSLLALGCRLMPKSLLTAPAEAALRKLLSTSIACANVRANWISKSGDCKTRRWSQRSSKKAAFAHTSPMSMSLPSIQTPNSALASTQHTLLQLPASATNQTNQCTSKVSGKSATLDRVRFINPTGFMSPRKNLDHPGCINPMMRACKP